ncbi:MAG: glycosyltransferase family 25 protein [Proteobacteria bacterium]|uniref:glycosyltransferase family 25 protein n=1 Tax=Aquabacterium sp. TaxID=1872578 RepID=UPI0035C686BF|nr:glycosyltransferase family 25 protein [Pseudomonadota bacterium]
MRPHVFLINLDRSADRLARCAPILDGLGLSWERVPGVEGKALGAERLKALNPHPTPHGEWFRPLTPGEIGCFLSHLRCWQLIEERGLDCALVLEDDFNAHDVCTLQNLQTLAASATGAHPWDVLKLTRLRRHARLVASLGDDGAGHALELRFGGQGPEDGTAYLVSRRGAAKLTPKREHLLRPVDFELKHHWERDLTVYSASPDFFWQVGSEIAASVIGDGRAAYRGYPLRQKAAVYLRKHRYHLRFWLANKLGLGRRKVLGG